MNFLLAFKKNLSPKYLIFIIFFSQIACQKKINNSSVDKPNSTLQNTYWKILQIGDHKIQQLENQRELHFILDLDSDVVRGHSGCNTFNGKYALSGSKGIEFSKMISTRMYCPDYNGEPLWFDFIEGQLSYEIKGDDLILVNKNKTKAKCQAVYLK